MSYIRAAIPLRTRRTRLREDHLYPMEALRILNALLGDATHRGFLQDTVPKDFLIRLKENSIRNTRVWSAMT